MTPRETYLTPESHKRLEDELDYLRREKRHAVAERIQRSKEIGGGTVDNAEYDDAKNEQSFAEGRIQELEWKLNQAILIPKSSQKEQVQIGSKVTVQSTLRKRQEYVIVGVDDSDPLAGRISHESPIGRALLNRRAGDQVEVHTPKGTVHLKVVKIS